jgi:hypothetical protein
MHTYIAQVWVPKATGESDCRTHIPRARPRVFQEKCINVERDPLLRSLGIPLLEKVRKRKREKDIYIYIEREREREKTSGLRSVSCVSVCTVRERE